MAGQASPAVLNFRGIEESGRKTGDGLAYVTFSIHPSSFSLIRSSRLKAADDFVISIMQPWGWQTEGTNLPSEHLSLLTTTFEAWGVRRETSKVFM